MGKQYAILSAFLLRRALVVEYRSFTIDDYPAASINLSPPIRSC